MIALGCDHGGYNLICAIKKYLDEKGLEYKEYGTFSEESVDYPVYAYKVATAITSGECSTGILCCGTGIGISIAANILCMGGRVTSEEDAVKFADIFLNTPYEGGRHENRVSMITDIENGTFKA